MCIRDSFIGVKSFKAKGKRISTYNIAEIKELEPTRFPEPPAEQETEVSDLTEESDSQEETDTTQSAENSTQPTLFDF